VREVADVGAVRVDDDDLRVADPARVGIAVAVRREDDPAAVG
jgi:hypothetical protein